MDRITRLQRRVLTPVGALVGLVVGFVVFQTVIGNRMIEAPRFVLAVFVGGGVGLILYTLIHDGVAILLRKQSGDTDAAAPAGATVAAAAASPAPAEAVDDAAFAPAAKPKRTTPLKAKRVSRPEPTEEDTDLVEDVEPEPAPSRPIRAARERPLKPPNRR
jgi:hypothetical protein